MTLTIGQTININMKTYNKHNVFLLMVGILTIGGILNILYEISPNRVVGIDNETFEIEYKQDVEYITSSPQEETILESAVSISSEDIIKNQKIQNIKRFFEQRNSPLAAYAKEFVEAAQYWNVDYRLVAAISVVESGGGKVNFRPYNAWGWGKYGFENWKDGIWSVTEGLATGYISKGLDTPLEIGRVYCPPSYSSWAKKVSSLMKEIGE